MSVSTKTLANFLRSAGLRLLLIAASVGVTLGILEAGVRLFSPQRTKVIVSAMMDPDLIFRLPANARGTEVQEEFAIRIETNAHGLRDRDFASEKPNGVVSRMLVLGDSMTHGMGVEAEDTYPKVLERLLAGLAGPGKYEVINAGIYGYGTDQEVVLFEKLIPLYHPDIALLAFFALNDFADNMNGRLFEVRDGRLVRLALSKESSPKYRLWRRLVAVRTFPGYQFLIAHSHLANLIRVRLWSLPEFQRVYFPQPVRADPSWEDRAWELTARLLERFLDLARQHDIRPLLLLIPSRDQVSPGSDALLDARMERVIAFAREQNVPIIDPRKLLKEAAAQGEVLFYPKDGHMTARGHRIVAEYVYRALSELGLVGYEQEGGIP
jgi:hypothetical protein